MVRRRRRSIDNDAAGSSMRWLLTYADMITLLMAFFIMLYSMSILNVGKFRQVAVSIKSGFKSLVDEKENMKISIESVDSGTEIAGIRSGVVKQIENAVKTSDLQKSVRIRADERGLIISMMTNQLMFTRGRAELTDSARGLLDKVGETINGLPNEIRVEGHTCDLPTHSEMYPSNWELSSARASSVVRYLIEGVNIPPDRLSVSGYADQRPILPNTSEENRRMNRRVDIVILKSDYP